MNENWLCTIEVMVMTVELKSNDSGLTFVDFKSTNVFRFLRRHRHIDTIYIILLLIIFV